MPRKEVSIDWDYSGKTDGLMGTGASATEKAVGWTSALILTVFFGVAISTGVSPSWSWWQWLLAAGLLFDVAGGVTANTLNSCKRFYNSPRQPDETALTGLLKNHFFFAALHIHPVVVAWAYGGDLVAYGLAVYAGMVFSVALLGATPLYLKRPVAFTLILLATGCSLYILPVPAGFEWFVPALFLKIVYGHSVREEPYRPS